MNKQTVNSGLLIKSSFWYTVANFLTKAISFITIPIFTRLMSKQEYADFSVFASWQSIFLIICGIEIYATLNRARFDYESEDELNSYITSCLLLSTALTGFLLIIYLLFPTFFDRLFLLDKKYIFLMFAYLFTQPAFQMFQAKQRVEYKYRLNAGISFFLIIFSTLFAVFLVHLFDDKLMGRIVGQFASYIFIGFIFYVLFVIRDRKISIDKWKYAINLGLPLVFSFLGSQILLSSDRVVVQHIGTREEVAWLVLATSAAHIILLFVQTLNNAWAPWFFDKLKAGQKDEIKKVFNVYMWFIVLCTFAVLMIGPEIVSVLGGKGYASSIYVLPANMLCGIFTAITAQFVNIQTYYKKTQYTAVLTSIVAAINVVGDIIAVKVFGYQGACYVTVFCQILLISMHYVISLQFDIKEILPAKQLAYVLLVSLCLIPVSLLLYQKTIIRIIFIVSFLIVACVLILISRYKLMSKIKNLGKSA